MTTAQFKNLSKGFTLIELLVVIGILGILATALIATIDPFEQLKKTNDANLKNAAVEVANANLRYYTTHSKMPWHTGGVTGCGSGGSLATVQVVSDTGVVNPCVQGLIDDGELKSQFGDADFVQGLYLSGTTGNEVSVCFLTESKSLSRDSATVYTSGGETQSGCPVTGNAANTTCHWCAKL